MTAETGVRLLARTGTTSEGDRPPASLQRRTHGRSVPSNACRGMFGWLSSHRRQGGAGARTEDYGGQLGEEGKRSERGETDV